MRYALRPNAKLGQLLGVVGEEDARHGHEVRVPLGDGGDGLVAGAGGGVGLALLPLIASLVTGRPAIFYFLFSLFSFGVRASRPLARPW
jgi:hypothetical protein